MTIRAIDPKDRLKLVALIMASLFVFGMTAFQTAMYDRAQQEMVARARAAAAAAAGMAASDGAPPASPGAPGA